MLTDGRRSRRPAVIVGLLATSSLATMLIVALVFATLAYDFGRHNYV